MPIVRQQAPYSRTHVNKCGELLERALFSSDAPVDENTWGDIEYAMGVVDWFRGHYAAPLNSVQMSLRSYVRTCGYERSVAQRLKRSNRIVRKLHRHRVATDQSTRVSAMEDIAGCRAILPDIPAVYAVADHIRTTLGDSVVRDRDYIANPKDTGYRSIHLVVRRHQRFVEIQLRTPGQQRWAEAVQGQGSRVNQNLQDGLGDPDILRYYARAADVIYSRESGTRLDLDAVEQWFEAERRLIERGLIVK